jgi:hypothetical protein
VANGSLAGVDIETCEVGEVLRTTERTIGPPFWQCAIPSPPGFRGPSGGRVEIGPPNGGIVASILLERGSYLLLGETWYLDFGPWFLGRCAFRAEGSAELLGETPFNGPFHEVIVEDDPIGSNPPPARFPRSDGFRLNLTTFVNATSETVFQLWCNSENSGNRFTTPATMTSGRIHAIRVSRFTDVPGTDIE